MTRHFDVDLTQLPTEIREENRADGLLRILFGLFFGGIPLWVLTQAAGPIVPQASAFLGLSAVAGLAVLGFGLHTFVFRRRITLDGQAVRASVRSLFGAESWSEDVRRYDGVLYTNRLVETRNSAYRMHVVEMHHADPTRRLIIHRSESEGAARAQWEVACRRFGLPALEPTAAGPIQRRNAQRAAPLVASTRGAILRQMSDDDADVPADRPADEPAAEAARHR